MGIIVSPIVFGLVAWELLADPCIQPGIERMSDCLRDTSLERDLYVYFGPIVTHYLIQLVLFKIVINFIVLGGKK